MFRAAAYSLCCHYIAMIIIVGSTVNKTETVTSICREVSVAISFKVLG